VVRLIDASPRPAVEWTRDSLEDACLGAMCNMAVWRESLGALERADAARCLRRLAGGTTGDTRVQGQGDTVQPWGVVAVAIRPRRVLPPATFLPDCRKGTAAGHARDCKALQL